MWIGCFWPAEARPFATKAGGTPRHEAKKLRPPAAMPEIHTTDEKSTPSPFDLNLRKVWQKTRDRSTQNLLNATLTTVLVNYIWRFSTIDRIVVVNLFFPDYIFPIFETKPACFFRLCVQIRHTSHEALVWIAERRERGFASSPTPPPSRSPLPAQPRRPPARLAARRACRASIARRMAPAAGSSGRPHRPKSAP